MHLANGSGFGSGSFKFIIDLQDANKKQIKIIRFFCILLFEGTFTSFFKIKGHKEVTNQVFFYYFCFMIEGSGSGSIPLTNGSGSGSRMPENMWIRWIRIRIRIRIRNTVLKTCRNSNILILAFGLFYQIVFIAGT
jgi:hypothetical protein